MSADRWVLVPVEPTPEMVRAMADAVSLMDFKAGAIDGYRAMIAAAPAAPAAESPEPQPQPLTDEQKRAMWRASGFRGSGGQLDWYMQGIEEAERAHGIGAPHD